MKRGLFRLQYELDSATPYTEVGSDKGAKLDAREVMDGEVRAILEEVYRLDYKDMMKWLAGHHDSESVVVVPLTTRTPEAMAYRLEGRRPKIIFVSRPLHTIERLDDFLYAASRALPTGAYVWFHTMTSVLRRRLVKSRYPWVVAQAVVGFQYLWNRVCPKLSLTRKFYYAVTGGKSRDMSRVEALGRLYRAGFEVLDEQFRNGEFVMVCRKAKAPVDDEPPTGSPIIHLSRIGRDGKKIVVHKFRTMYSYSEYIQDYIYHHQSLERGGKFKDDYRINFWGKILRRTWLDELPMVWNMLRGEMKLVGVRPLSSQYFNLYTPEMQALRTRTKPGLLPPFYYEERTPQTLDEIQASERRYLEAYLQAPFKTDWKYFWGIVGNIVFRRKHSA